MKFRLLVCAVSMLVLNILPALANDGGKAACDAGDAGACAKGGLSMMMVQRYDLAMELYKKACDGENYQGCHFVGRFYDIGSGVKPDAVKAREYFSKACLVGAGNACFWVADMYKDGEGGAASAEKAVKHYISGCRLIGEKDCETNSQKYLDGTEQLSAQVKEHMKTMQGGYKRACRSLYFSC